MLMAKEIETMSGGRLKLQVSPSGTYVGAFEILVATHKGVLDAAHSCQNDWIGKSMAAALFGPPPAGPLGRSALGETSSCPGCTTAAAWNSTTSCCRKSSK
jgi:TRAP-type mannitol/chloroaromatic compound transport system substrate-binding protein